MRSLALASLLLFAGCHFTPGNVTVRLEWVGAPPQLANPLYAYARVEERPGDPTKPGTPIQLAGPATYTGAGAHLDFNQFPNGKSLVVIVELHQTADLKSPVVYDGASAAFTLEAGETRTITVPLGPIAAAPATAAAGRITYVRTPWGSQATGGTPSFAVNGLAGAVPPDTTVVVYDGADPLTATELGRATADSTGAFTATLARADHSVVYVATIDPSGNDSITAPVHDITWTATFGGKTAGSTLANPHVLELAADFSVVAAQGQSDVWLGALAQDPSLTREAPNYAALALPDGQTLPATTATAWRPRMLNGENPPPRYWFGMDYDSARGVSVLFGGNGTETLLNDTWEWDGNVWNNVTPIGESPAPRVEQGMVYDAALGVSVLFGGDTTDIMGAASDDNVPPVVPLGDTWTWDGHTWTNVTPATGGPPARIFPAMAYDSHRGVVVLFGGCKSNASGQCPNSVFNDTWEWNGTSWTDVTPTDGSSPPKVTNTAITFDSVRNVTLIYGGVDDLSGRYKDLYAWDGHTYTKLPPAGDAPPTDALGQMVFDAARGVAVLIGGDIAAGSPYDTLTNGIWEWNGSSWASVTPTTAVGPQVLVAHSAAYDTHRETVVVFGGQQSNAGGSQIDTWEWKDATWTDIVASGETPAPRTSAAAAYDSARGVTVMTGGCGQVSTGMPSCPEPFAETWEWDGHSWTDVLPASGAPSARGAQQLVYDTQRGVSVLFGGCCDVNGNAFGDTWEWDGTGWTNVTPTSGPNPPGRLYAAMSYDSGRGVTVLTGGCDSLSDCDGVCTSPGVCGPAVLLNDVWEWNGTQWTNATPPPSANAPSGRGSPALAYDARDGVTVLFGGNDSSRASPNDTWTWDGTTWTQLNPATKPPGRLAASFTWDTGLSQLLLVGGYGADFSFVAETWQWDGSTWTNVTPVTTASPAVSEAQSMTYDAARGAMVLFGGDSGGETFNDLWELSAEAPRRSAEVARFSFAAAGAVAPSIQQLSFTAVAGATGNDPVAQGAGLAVWDSWSGVWKQVATNGATPTNGAALQYTSASASEATRYLFSEDQSINVALWSPPGVGNGANPASIAVDSLELTVSYTQP